MNAKQLEEVKADWAKSLEVQKQYMKACENIVFELSLHKPNPINLAKHRQMKSHFQGELAQIVQKWGLAQHQS